MGTECFNGKNKDIDLLLNPQTIEKRIKLNSKNSKHSNSNQNMNQKLNIQQGYKTFFEDEIFYKSSSSSNIFNKKLSNKSRSNSSKNINFRKKKNIHNFTNEELKDKINDILRIKVFFFENSFLKTLSAFTFLSGNGPYHEGLMIFTSNKNFYIAQSYPITFIKVYDYYKGISDIISFNSLNSNSKQYNVSEIYTPKEKITLFDILNIINNMPNRYNLFNNNCQNFCDNILKTLNKKYKIEMNDSPNISKIDFLKKQKQIKGYNLPIYRPIRTVL